MDDVKAEFCLCLARAFLPPQDKAAQTALQDYLVDDLAELAGTLGYALDAPLAALRDSLAAYPDAAELLPLYSRLFLIPGVEHPHINTGAYIDGAMHGDTVRKLAECYRACGLEKTEGFGDLPDHAAVQLEFAAWLFANAAERAQGVDIPQPVLSAGDFIAGFVQGWAAPLAHDLSLSNGRFALTHNPWQHLAEIVNQVAAVEATAFPLAAQREETDIERLRREYAGRMPSAEELAEIRAKLEQDGLSAAHIDIPLEQRDAHDGLTALEVPQLRRHTLQATNRAE